MTKTKNYAATVLSLISLSTPLIISESANAVDIKETYSQALSHDKTYLQAKYTYESAKTAAPIALAGLLPNVSLTANSTANKSSTTNNNKFYNSHSATLTLGQTLFNWGTFQTYSQARYVVIQAKIAYEIAKQTLITSVVKAYFNVLNGLDNVNYSEINLAQKKENLSLAKAQFKVGLIAKTDVASAKAGYEQAIADLSSSRNQLENNLSDLTIITNKNYNASDFSLLKPGFLLAKPSPANIESWSNAAANNNLSVLSAGAQVNIDKKQVSIDAGGYLPNATFEATGKRAVNDSSSTAATKTYTYGAKASWNIGSFATLDDSSGNNTFFTVKKDKLTLNSDQAALAQARRQAISEARTDYLTILSDISQIEAYRQAVISGISAVAAAVAKYEAGTETIINVLQQQATLYNNRLSLSNGINTFFNDRVILRASVGQLSEKDIDQLNQLLISSSTSVKPQAKTKAKPVKATAGQQQKLDDKAGIYFNKVQIQKDKKKLRKVNINDNTPSFKMPSEKTTDNDSGGVHFHSHTHNYYSN